MRSPDAVQCVQHARRLAATALVVENEDSDAYPPLNMRFRIVFPLLCISFFCARCLWAADPEPPPQPIPYSHKTHAAAGLQCRDCHEMPGAGKTAGYPREEKCMACHAGVKRESPAIQKLAQYYKDRKPVPWARVYQIPDYVFFSHKVHLSREGISCETCHGPVAERDVIKREKPVNMADCMFCHDQWRVPIACNACHE